MSSDNFLGVFSSYDSLGRPERWYVREGGMSDIETPQNEEEWKKGTIASKCPSYPTRAAALEAAHDEIKENTKNYNCPVIEYGVIEI